MALRELVRGKPASEWSVFVRERVHAFVGDEAWQRESRSSWLEGFDIVVAGRNPDAFLSDLSAVASSGGSRGAQFAAFLASDRLMLAEPAKTLATLNENPALYAREPNVRAGLFARADVRRSDQLRQLESYLRRPDVSATEREAFAGLFPHYDLAVSFNLLTPPSSRQMADMIAHDRAALRQIEAWLSDPDFADWHSGLRTVQDRLREQLGEADRG